MTIKEMLEIKNELGYSYRFIARNTGLPLSTVQKVLGGFTENPRRETMLALKRFFRYAAEYEDYDFLPEDHFEVNESTITYGSSALKPYDDEEYDDPYASEGRRTRKYIGAKAQGEYTSTDILALPNGVRAELIDGVIYDLAAPSLEHQQLVLEIGSQISRFIKKNKGKCTVVTAPFAVTLNEDDKTYLEPDILVVCDETKVTNLRIIGAPDFIVEVLSPSTSRKDRAEKYLKYRRSGVREYWLVDPELSEVECFFFEKSSNKVYNFTDKIPVEIFDGKLQVDLSL